MYVTCQYMYAYVCECGIMCMVGHGMCAKGCPVIVARLFAFQHRLMATGSTHIGGLVG